MSAFVIAAAAAAPAYRKWRHLHFDLVCMPLGFPASMTYSFRDGGDGGSEIHWLYLLPAPEEVIIIITKQRNRRAHLTYVHLSISRKLNLRPSQRTLCLKKTTPMLRTITSNSTSTDFGNFLAEMSPREHAIEWWFVIPHILTIMSWHYLGKHEPLEKLSL